MDVVLLLFCQLSGHILIISFISEELTSVRVLISMAILFMVGALGYPPFFKQMSTGILKIGLMSVLSAIAGNIEFILVGRQDLTQ